MSGGLRKGFVTKFREVRDQRTCGRWPLWALRFAVRPHLGGLGLVLIFAAAMLGVGLLVPPLTGADVDAIRAGDGGQVRLLAAALIGVGAVEAVLAFLGGRRRGARVLDAGHHRHRRTCPRCSDCSPTGPR